MAAVPLVVCDDPAPGVRVARFAHPNNLPHLYDSRAAIEESPLYQALRTEALDGLAPGGAVVLNFGLVEPFPTAFYRLLLKVHEQVTAAGGRVFLCCLTPNVRECLALMGDRVYAGRVRESEGQAVFDAQQPAG